MWNSNKINDPFKCLFSLCFVYIYDSAFYIWCFRQEVNEFFLFISGPSEQITDLITVQNIIPDLKL